MNNKSSVFESSEKVRLTKEELLKTILARKRTSESLIEKFGYCPETVPLLKELLEEGKIKRVEGYQKGLRSFYVKPDFNESLIEKKSKEPQPSAKVKAYQKDKKNIKMTRESGPILTTDFHRTKVL